MPRKSSKGRSTSFIRHWLTLGPIPAEPLLSPSVPLSAGATTEIVSGLFARRCVLVEGRTEALALPELLRARGLDVMKEGIAIVPVEGIGNIAKWYRFYKALGLTCFCLFDTDSSKSGGEAAQLLAKRLDIGTAIGLEGDPAESGVLLGAGLFVAHTYATLDPDFEGALDAMLGDRWAQLYGEAVQSVGDSKPLRAGTPPNE